MEAIVQNEHGMAQRNGIGMLLREVMNRFPLLPIEEEGQPDSIALNPHEAHPERLF
jgi:hypothetical protein